jgi:hypothetical protein
MPTQQADEKKPAEVGGPDGVVRVPLEALVALAPRLSSLTGEEGYYIDVADEARKARELLSIAFRCCGIAHEMPVWPPSDSDLKRATTAVVKSGRLYWSDALDLLESLDLPTSLADHLRERPSGSPL